MERERGKKKQNKREVHNMLNELKARMEKVECRMWMLEMADYLYGAERAEWERLHREKMQLIVEIAKLENK